MTQNYNKKSIWKWILLYVVIGALIYGAVYYFFFYKNGGYNYNSQNYQTQNNIPTQTAGWKTYSDNQNGFLIQYPSDWQVAANVIISSPNLVFCPNSLATDPDPQIICKEIAAGTNNQPSYAKGMIYLFVYNDTSKPNNPNYHYLGMYGKNSYYLYSEGNDGVVNQMISTFKFTIPTQNNQSGNVTGIDQYINNKNPGKVDNEDYLLDLNGDGKLDLLQYIQNPNSCGTGGCALSIFINEGTSFVLMQEIYVVHSVYLANTYTNGWRDIIVGVGGGGYVGTGVVKLQYDGKKYPENPADGIEVAPSSINNLEVIF